MDEKEFERHTYTDLTVNTKFALIVEVRLACSCLITLQTTLVPISRV